jgi:hypothetical protein
MERRKPRELRDCRNRLTLSSLPYASALLAALALASCVALGCSKDKKDEADAAAVDAAPEAAAAVDAAADADADAADAATADAATAPLATVAPVAKPKPKPDPPICANARSARKRNSPAAAALEAQCRAAGGTP